MYHRKCSIIVLRWVIIMPIPQCLCICINTTDRIIILLKLHRRGDLPGAKTNPVSAAATALEHYVYVHLHLHIR